MNEIKVAVYGTLRQNESNNRLLVNSTHLGDFNTEPEYTFFNLGWFPGIVKGGNQSVKCEVYAIDQETLERLHRLEGYREGSDGNLYNLDTIETPYGNAFIYTYNNDRILKKESLRIIESGDWKKR